jgi:hypothetical protein
MRLSLIVTTAAASLCVADAASYADDAAPSQQSFKKILNQHFTSSRLFEMPIADVVGAFQISFSGDGSLLKQPGLLTSSGVVALGFGDIAQLEYRNSAAVGVTGVEAPLPAVGVQLKIPLPNRQSWPAFAVAFRLGVPRREQVGADAIEESVTDLYIVGRLHLWGPLSTVTLHGGSRISSAKAAAIGTSVDATEQQRLLILPAGGWEWIMNPTARMVGEISLAPQFRWDPTTAAPPTIEYGLLGRLGLRWNILPAVTFDGSIGYKVEVDRTQQNDSLRSLVQWDIRLGAEFFIPWGALACRGIGVFCSR